MESSNIHDLVWALMKADIPCNWKCDHKCGSPVTDHIQLYVKTDTANLFKEMPGFIPREYYPAPIEENNIEAGAIGNLRIMIDDDFDGIRIEMKNCIGK